MKIRKKKLIVGEFNFVFTILNNIFADMKTQFIKETEQYVIAKHLHWLCNMGGMLPPENDPTEFITFLRMTYGKYDIILLPRAFEFWAAGNLPLIKPVKVVNMFFISTLLNAYLDVNGRLIPTEPKKYLQAPQEQRLDRIDYNVMIDQCKKEVHGMENSTKAIFYSRWSICWKYLENDIQDKNFSDDELSNIVQYFFRHDKKVFNLEHGRNPKQWIKNMIARHEDVFKNEKYETMIRNAARFYITVKSKKI
jgi:hypothetical protein